MSLSSQLLVGLSLLVVTLSARAVVPWTLLVNTNNIITVTNAPYGAVGDGVFTNTTAIQNAINQAAKGGTTNGLSGGTVKIPGSGIYLCGPLSMSNYVNLQIDAGAILRVLPYGSYPGAPDYTNAVFNFINGSSLHDVAISGPGAIDGQGSPWWQANAADASVNRPRMINLAGCSQLLIQNITLSNSPMFHIAIGSSGGNKTVQGVIIRAPSSSDPVNPSHNTDACDVAGTNILVQNCDISVGDDDFACTGGTYDVLITNNVYGSGHGVSIGSYTSPGVSNFTVINCSFNGTDSGFKVKSMRGRGGLVQNLKYINIMMTNVDWPISFDAHYEWGLGQHTTLTPAFVANNAFTNPASLIVGSTPIIQNITVSNVTAVLSSSRPPFQIWGLPEALVSNVVFRAVNITSSAPYPPAVYDATNIQLIDCTFNLAAGANKMQLWNAGVIFTNSAGSPTLTNLWQFDGLTTNLLIYNGSTSNLVGNSLQFFNTLGSLSNTNALDDGPLTLSASTFTVSNNLSLAPNNVVSFTLGTNTTKLAVVGNLTLGGTNNISAGPGFTNGTYTLMTYSGTLSGAVPTLGMTPAGYTYAFDTTTAGQMKLVVTTAITAPATPSGLSATAGNAQVALSWSASSGATGYNVKRATASGGPYTTITNVTATSHTDTGLTNGTTYYYVVSAVNAGGESANSAEVNATPLAIVFSDNFSGSSLNSSTPSTPTATDTSYQLSSSKTWNPAPSLAAGHLKYGIAATSSGVIEAQALFTSSPVTLATVGDRLSLTVTFTNTTGLFAQAGAMGFGLYNSGQNGPVPGGLNGTATSSNTNNATGNAQNWVGYVGQLSFTNASSQILTRAAQSGTGNNNQDLVTSGSGSSSYSNPGGSTVGTASSAASVVLPTNNLYTAVFTITLTAGNTLAITNSLYAGADTTGTLLSQFGGIASGSTYLTNSFDALAIGWRATAATAPTMIDINSISVSTSGTANQVSPPATPTGLAATAGNAQAVLVWNASSGATSYNVKRATVSGGPYTTITNLATTGFTDTGLVNGTTYYYVVSALNAGGESGNSTEASATPQVTPPAVPTGLAATAGNAQAALNWNASSGATSYNVKRATVNGGPYTTITNVTATSFNNSGLVNGTTYYYVVSAVNAGGESGNSTQVSATPTVSVPPTITGLTNQIVNARFNVTLAPVIGGSPTPARQWSVNGTPIPGATGATLTLTNVQLSQNGYVYSLTATNTSGVVTSNMVLTVTNALFNVQLNGLGATYSGVGQIGSAGDVWNNPALANFDNSGTQHSPSAAIITGYGLTDSRGVASPVTLSMTGTNYKSYYGTSSGHGEVAGLNNQSLKFDWTGATPVPSATISLAGLPPNASLNLFGYGSTYYTSPIGSIWTFAAANGGASAGQTGTNGMDLTQAANEGSCWVKIVGTTDSGGNLTVNVTPQSAGVWWQTYLNGFQVQLHTRPLVTGLTNLTVVQGNSATLAPTITGTPAPTFQWQTNGVNIAGATNASLALNNVQYTQNGYVYSLVCSNQAGVVTNSMTLTVIVTPSIANLNNQTATPGDTVSISPTVSGVPTPSLQWRLNGNTLADGATGNGSTISGSTSGTLTITSAQEADSGLYSLVASNSAGVVTNSMTLTVSSSPVAPNITGPSNQTAIQGSNATFTASVSGLPVPTLQWLENGTPIGGATSSTLTLNNVQYSQNNYTYSLVASNSAGVVTNSATLTVLVPPAISQQPTNLAVVVGSPATFNVTAGGVPAPSYQWNRNGSPIGGATSSSYTLSNPQGADNGAVFSVTVSNTVNAVTSSGATLTVLSTMTGTFLPTNGAVNISPDQQLRIVFAGGSPRLNTNGTLTVRDAADNSLVQTIDASQFLAYTPANTSVQTIPNAAVRFTQGSYSGTGAGSTGYYYMPIALYGNEAWITLTNRLAYGHTYYATCDTGLFLDSSNASFAGITGTNTWRLSTKAAGPATPTINSGPTSVTVGQDGAGDFATFQGAFDWIPASNTLARTVHVLPGIYRDSATLAGNRNFVTIVGDGASRTNAQLIYPFIYFAPPNPVFTAGSLRIESSDVAVVNLTVDNIIYGVYHPTGYASSGAAGAFAGAINTLATTGKRIVFDNVLIKGGQDTIYNIVGIVYYHNCEVWGSVDFIYGSALGVFDQCNIVEIRSTGGPITAPNTAYAQPYGLVCLNCTFPRALVANGYPYDVNAGSTTFQRAWGQDGMTTIFNCAVDSQMSTAGWGTFGTGGENTCRAREYGTTLIGGGSATTIAQRQAAGAYWLNTLDPDYTNNPSLSPTDPLLAPPTGTNNRVAVTVNPNDYTLAAIFGNSYFNLNGWLPAIAPTITSQPTNQTVNAGATVTLSVAAVGLPQPTFQWLKNGTNVSGANSSTLTIPGATAADSGNYTVLVSNSAGSVVSSTAVIIVAPNPPTGLIATGGEARVALSWNASSGAASYNVKRATVNGGPYTTITNIAATSFTNSGLVNGTTYYYVVSALNAGGESANSAQASATPQVPPPAAPTGLSATAGNTQVTLNWSASSGATSYNVKRATVNGGPYTTITNITATGYTDASLVNGTTYYYVVTALNAGGESANSAQASATPQTSAPSAPTGLTATAGNAQAVLSWTAASGATSYNVKRSLTSGSGYATVTNVTATTVVDSGLSNGTTYYYVVSALNAGGESANSTEASVTPTDLSGWWTFDEGSGTTAADSSGGNNATLMSGATWTTGISSNAVHLDGTANGYVSLSAGLVSTLNDFSVATWVKVDTNATWSRIFDLGSGTGTYMYLTPSGGAGTLRYAITTNSAGGEQPITGPTALSTGIWHHVAVTLSGSVGVLYVDGTAVGTNSSLTLKPSSLGSTTQNYIGKSQWNDPYLNGSVDDFRLYGRALSASEVLTLADAGLPSPWNTSDIGAVNATGAADYVNGVFTVQGAGANIGGAADAFRFVYQPSSGDCSNTVRVASIQNTGANAKAGVMIRESLAANAREAGMWVTPASVVFTYRSSTGGSTTVSTSTGKTAPYWVRIARVGNSFRAYYSANGTTWTQLGSKTINMATSTYIGMGVDSGTNVLNTATLDNTMTVP